MTPALARCARGNSTPSRKLQGPSLSLALLNLGWTVAGCLGAGLLGLVSDRLLLDLAASHSAR